MQPIEPTRAAARRPLEDLLTDVRPTLLEAMRRFGVPPQDGEDLLQDTLVHFLRKRADLSPNPAGWLVLAFRHACMHYVRCRERRFVDAVDATFLDGLSDRRDTPADRQVMHSEVRTVFGRLRDRCRSLLSLRYGLDCEARVAAKSIGCSIESVDKITRRCLAALGRHLYAIGKRSHA